MVVKRRKGEENIGRIIVFAITIVVAVGLTAIISYFFNKYRNQAIDLAVLTSTTSSLEDITDRGFCSDSTTTAYIKYNAYTDQYTLHCASGSTSTLNTGNIAKVGWLILVDCDGSKTDCTYKLTRTEQ